jgi:hypothetical protein
MEALLKQYDAWWKSFEPGYRVALKRADEMIERFKDETQRG